MNAKTSVWLAALAVGMTLNASAATRTWTNAAGDGDWHNTANWSGGALPSASDTATISISEDTTLYVTNDVQVTRFWTVGTGTLTVAPGADGAGSVYANGGNNYRYFVFSNAVSAVYNVPVKIRGTNEPRFRFAGATTFNRKFTFLGGPTWSLDHLANGSTLTFNDELVAENETIELSADRRLYAVVHEPSAQDLRLDHREGRRRRPDGNLVRAEPDGDHRRVRRVDEVPDEHGLAADGREVFPEDRHGRYGRSRRRRDRLVGDRASRRRVSVGGGLRGRGFDQRRRGREEGRVGDGCRKGHGRFGNEVLLDGCHG